MSIYVLKNSYAAFQARYLHKDGKQNTVHYKNAKKFKTKEAALQYLLRKELNTYYQVVTVVSQRYSLV